MNVKSKIEARATAIALDWLEFARSEIRKGNSPAKLSSEGRFNPFQIYWNEYQEKKEPLNYRHFKTVKKKAISIAQSFLHTDAYQEVYTHFLERQRK